jgi:hypothetical protein
MECAFCGVTGHPHVYITCANGHDTPACYECAPWQFMSQCVWCAAPISDRRLSGEASSSKGLPKSSRGVDEMAGNGTAQYIANSDTASSSKSQDNAVQI